MRLQIHVQAARPGGARRYRQITALSRANPASTDFWSNGRALLWPSRLPSAVPSTHAQKLCSRRSVILLLASSTEKLPGRDPSGKKSARKSLAAVRPHSNAFGPQIVSTGDLFRQAFSSFRLQPNRPRSGIRCRHKLTPASPHQKNHGNSHAPYSRSG
jgi:hypothetical protein